MTWNLDAVGQEVSPVEQSWTSSDSLLYSLGVGARAQDPFGQELEFTTENSEGMHQKVLPTFGVAFAFHNSAHALARSLDGTQSVHGEQAISRARPIPPEGRVVTTGRLTGVYDKGSGAEVTTEARSVDASSGEPMFTTRSSLFVRGGGGFSMEARFAREVRPGDRLTVHVWRNAPVEAAFRLHTDPGTVGIDRGRIVYRDTDADGGGGRPDRE